jgi:hypothetical protein
VTAQAVAERQEALPETIVENHPATNDMLALIERMAVNPNIDPAKLERLIAMKKDIDATGAKLAFNAALVEMQPKLPAIEKRGKTDKAEYAKWEDIQDGILPVLSGHGFALSFKTESSGETITVTAILRHAAGHDDSTSLTLPADKGPGRNSVQAVGSSVSYGKRYTASALLNLRIGGEDDDGAKAIASDLITEAQEMQLRDLLEETKAGRAGHVPAFLKYMRVSALGDIRARDFKRAVDAINSTRVA